MREEGREGRKERGREREREGKGERERAREKGKFTLRIHSTHTEKVGSQSTAAVNT